jgi:hypothetical protein
MAFTTKKNGSEKRTAYPKMSFRVDEAEKAYIESAAEREGLTPGSYMRSRCLAKPTTRAVRRAPIETRQLARLLGLLGVAGGMMQALLEKQGGGNTVSAAEVQEAMQEFRAASAAILLAMGRRPALPKGRGP